MTSESKDRTRGGSEQKHPRPRLGVQAGVSRLTRNLRSAYITRLLHRAARLPACALEARASTRHDSANERVVWYRDRT